MNGEIWNWIGYDKVTNNTFVINNGNGYIKLYDYFWKSFFEGEYKNGEKNGKGKEYNENGIILYEGKFDNGIKVGCGKGKEYDSFTDKLKYEGHYFDGKKEGEGKEYNTNDCLILEGKFKNGKRLRGKEYANKKLIFERECYEGKRWKGKLYDMDFQK